MNEIPSPSDSKVLKYESFVNDQLKPDLKYVLEKRDKIYSEISEFLALKNSVLAIQSADLKPGQPLQTKVDIGCNFYCNASATDPSKIFVEIGLGFYLELGLKEAIDYVDKKVTVLEKEAVSLTKESCKIKASIKLVLQGLAEIQSIAPPTEKKRPVLRDI
eukprot:TRINITY_DN22159_c0_g1_i1.p2 TRINITY_DN22159_c0_g1~~TRINITY_DN22159_c0_g1_i1.p2  ORF type:complete len:161 (+),score=39.12 TRINITY_DN22159_c0_g1_i1:49-531(+)